jgi:hypothetical protein
MRIQALMTISQLFRYLMTKLQRKSSKRLVGYIHTNEDLLTTTQALKDTQLQLGELRDAFHKLKIKNATLSSNQLKWKHSNVPKEISKHSEEIAMLGRKLLSQILVDVD